MSFISVLFPDTGDYAEIADAKTAAGQATWERATAAAIEFAQNPGEVAGAKLLALIGGRSSLGDPTDPDWLEGLRPGQRAVALEQLAHAVASWHLQSGRNADGSPGPTVEGVTTVVAQAGAIVTMPTGTKASTAAALCLAAMQAGPQRGDLLVKAAIAQQEAERDAAAARRRTAPATRGRHRMEPEDAAEALQVLARYRARLASEAKAAGASADEVDAIRGKTAAPASDLVATEELYVRDAPAMLFKRVGASGRGRT